MGFDWSYRIDFIHFILRLVHRMDWGGIKVEWIKKEAKDSWRLEWMRDKARREKRIILNQLCFSTNDMMSQAQPSRNQLLTTFFRDPEYLARFPLTMDNVMNYFYTSTFFQRSSNNGQLAMQATGQGTQITQKAMDESLRWAYRAQFQSWDSSRVERIWRENERHGDVEVKSRADKYAFLWSCQFFGPPLRICPESQERLKLWKQVIQIEILVSRSMMQRSILILVSLPFFYLNLLEVSWESSSL